MFLTPRIYEVSVIRGRCKTRKSDARAPDVEAEAWLCVQLQSVSPISAFVSFDSQLVKACARAFPKGQKPEARKWVLVLHLSFERNPLRHSHQDGSHACSPEHRTCQIVSSSIEYALVILDSNEIYKLITR